MKATIVLSACFWACGLASDALGQRAADEAAEVPTLATTSEPKGYEKRVVVAERRARGVIRKQALTRLSEMHSVDVSDTTVALILAYLSPGSEHTVVGLVGPRSLRHELIAAERELVTRRHVDAAENYEARVHSLLRDVTSHTSAEDFFAVQRASGRSSGVDGSAGLVRELVEAWRLTNVLAVRAGVAIVISDEGTLLGPLRYELEWDEIRRVHGSDARFLSEGEFTDLGILYEELLTSAPDTVAAADPSYLFEMFERFTDA